MSWKSWSQNLYNNYAQHLQARYDKFREIKTPAWYIQVTDKIWAELDTTAKKFLNDIAVEAASKFGDEFAEKIVTDILKRLR